MSCIPASSLFTPGSQTAFMRRMLIENFVLTELMSMKEMHPYFWRSKRGADVEFLVQNGQIIFPVDVKSGGNTRSKRLAEFRKKYLPKISLRTSMVNLGEKTTSMEHSTYLLWNTRIYLEQYPKY